MSVAKVIVQHHHMTSLKHHVTCNGTVGESNDSDTVILEFDGHILRER